MGRKENRGRDAEFGINPNRDLVAATIAFEPNQSLARSTENRSPYSWRGSPAG